MRDTGSTRRASGLLEPPVERGWADKADSRPPLRGPGGWGGDWYVWHAPDGLRARAATALGCMQAGAEKLGVIEASYASAIIGVLSPVSSHCVFLPLDEPLVHACQEWASGGGAPLQRKFVGAGCVRRFLRRTGTPGFQTVWDTTADGESVRIESEPVFRCPDGRHEDRKCWQLVELGIHGLNRWLVKC